MAVAAGEIIYAADVLDLRTVTYVKAALTARNSGGTGTTFTDDPELVNIPLGVGTYDVELVLFFTLTTTATQKIKTRWSFTGTWNNQVRAVAGPGSAQTAAPGNVTEGHFAAYRAADQDAVYDIAAGGTYGIARETGIMVVTVAGTMALSWAQNAASANNTTVQAGTFFRVRKAV